MANVLDNTEDILTFRRTFTLYYFSFKNCLADVNMADVFLDMADLSIR